MTVKRQFLLLAVGIFIIPLMTLSFVVDSLSDSSMRSFIFNMSADERAIQEWVVEADASNFPTLKSPEVAILKNGELLYSFPRFENELALTELFTQFDLVSTSFDYNKDAYQILHLYQNLDIASLENYWAFLVPALLLFFLVGMSSWILKTLHSKITKLVNATKILAHGDFNEPLIVEGNDEFTILAQSLEGMREQIASDQKDRTRLLMGISHDLKTPLSSIKGYVQVIKDGLADSPEKQKQYFDIISEKSNLLEQRIAALIEFVKLETAEWTKQKDSSPARQTIQSWFDEFDNDIEVSGRFCNQSIKVPDGTIADFDRALVRRALENLVSNAIKYSPTECTISLSCVAYRDEFQFTVSNAGTPFSEDERQQLFSAFYRTDPGRNQEGMGLGLTVVEKVAQLHDGRASYSFNNQHHCFSLSLPTVK
jgi:signal transduction histidine kinase